MTYEMESEVCLKEYDERLKAVPKTAFHQLSVDPNSLGTQEERWSVRSAKEIEKSCLLFVSVSWMTLKKKPHN